VEDARGDAVLIERQAHPDRHWGRPPAPACNESARDVIGAHDHRGYVGAQHGTDRLGDCSENLLLRRLLRHEHRDAPQRSLLVGQALEILARLSVRDSGRHELREGRDPRFGILRQRLLPARRGHQRAPEPSLDKDRRADRRAQA
jgi:hypothetical protein